MKNPVAFTITATGFTPTAQVFAEQCDGTSPATVGWQPTSNCDLGTSPAPVTADSSGNVTFLASDINHAFVPFKGESPQGLFNCLSAHEADPNDGLPSFTNCQLRVSTNNTAVTSDQSFLTMILPEPTAPGAPTGVVAKSGSTTAATGSLVVTYVAPANNGGSAITQFTATCTSSNAGVTKTGTHVGSTAVAITVAAVTTAKTYTCKVTATNTVGTSVPSAASLAVIVGSPAPPSGVVAKSGSTTTATGSLVVTFTIGANNGSAIQSQTATCISSNAGVTKTATHTGATAAPITVAGVTTAKTYTCKVTAKNARGVGLASPPSLPVIVGSPAPPTAVHAVHHAAGQIQVTFTIGANNGSAIQSQTATCTSSNGGVTKTGTHGGATAAPITVTALTVGKTYTCKVTAKNARGVVLASAASNAAVA
jgi:large repetitive protein